MPFAWKAAPVAIFFSCAALIGTSQFGCGKSEHAESTRVSTPVALNLRTERSSPLDLEVGGEIRGVPAGSTRYLTRRDLTTLPQTSAHISDDPNFAKPVRILGIYLEDLAESLAAAGDSA